MRTPLFWVRKATQEWRNLPEPLKLDSNLARLQVATQHEAGLEAMIVEVKRHMPRAPQGNAEDRQYAATCIELTSAFAARGDEAGLKEVIRWASTVESENLSSYERERALTALVAAGRGADAMTVAATASKRPAEHLTAYLTVAIEAGQRGDRALYDQAMTAARRVPVSTRGSQKEADAHRAVELAEAMVEAGQTNEALRATAAMDAVGKARIHAAIAQFHFERNDLANAAKYARMAAGVVKSTDLKPPNALTEIGRRLAKIGDSSALREFERVLKFDVPAPPRGPGPSPRRSARPVPRTPPRIDASLHAEARVQAAGAACTGLIEGFAQAGEGALALKYREIGRAAAEKIERASGFPINRSSGGVSIFDRTLIETLQDRGQTQAAVTWAKRAIDPAAITPSDKSDGWQFQRAVLAAAYVRDGQLAEAQRIIAPVEAAGRHEYHRAIALRHVDDATFNELLTWAQTLPPTERYGICKDVAQYLLNRINRSATTMRSPPAGPATQAMSTPARGDPGI